MSTTEEKTRPPAWALPLDTSLEARRVQVAMLRRMGPEKRAEQLIDVCESVREWARIGIRHRHPDYGERQVNLALFRLQVGDELFRKAFTNETIEP